MHHLGRCSNLSNPHIPRPPSSSIRKLRFIYYKILVWYNPLMVREQLSLPPEIIENKPNDPVVKMTGDLVSIIGKHATPQELLQWVPHAYNEREAGIFRTLSSTLSSVTHPDEEGITYPKLINLIDASTSAGISVVGITDDMHTYMLAHLDEMSSLLRQHNGEGVDKVVSLLSCNPNPRSDAFILDHFAQAVVKSPDGEDFDWLFDNFFVDKRADLVPRLVQSFSRTITDWVQLDPDIEQKVLEWSDVPTQQYTEAEHSWAIEHLKETRDHVRTLVALEREAYGSTEYLMNTYNIHCFSRYPEELLLNQYRERNGHTGKPYGLLINALHDWNQSGRLSERGKTFGRFYQQVKEAGFEMRAVEVATPDDLVYFAHREVKEHGQMDFAVVNGHANIFGIALGERKNDAILYRDFYKRASYVVTDAVKPGGTIFLTGCSLGKIGGFAQKLSERGFTVIASNTKSSLSGLTFFPEENPPIDASFRNTNELQIYRDGNLLMNQGERAY